MEIRTEAVAEDSSSQPSRERRTRRQLLTAGAVTAAGAAGAAGGYVLHAKRPRWRNPAAEAIPEFARHAALIRQRQSSQTLETVASLRRKYQDPVFGKARVWDMIEKLGLCIDPSDDSLMLTSQHLHVQQILEGMERDGVGDRDLLLIALLHDIGKVMMLAGEVPEHVVGYIHPMGEPAHGVGLDQVMFQFGHDEFAYSRLKDHVPSHIAWTIRYHSAMTGAIRPFCSPSEQAVLDNYHARFQPYDLARKSYSHLPRVNLAKYRALIEDTFPQPILF
ncbi:MAG: inositol oxygenase family protein [Bryobacteraceae bacterium]|jgi:predicted HD phosphohydrolase